MRRFGVLLTVLCVIGACATFESPYLLLSTGQGIMVERFPVGERDTFGITYIHSVARSPCTEYFVKGKGNRIRLVKTRYQGLGAGLPFGGEEGTLILEKEALVITDMNRSFETISIKPYGSTHHTFFINTRHFSMMNLVPQRCALTISIHTGSLIGYVHDRFQKEDTT